MRLAGLFKRLGPGFITGVSDDDPSAIATYAQTGAQFGLGQLWTAFFTWPLMSAVQEMCGRIGRVTGLGLGGVMRRHYARPFVYAIIGAQVLVNSVTIGADLSGMAQSEQLLLHVPYAMLLAITTVVTISLLVFVPYGRYVIYLRVVGLTLLTYVFAAATLRVDWGEVARAALSPALSFDKDYLLALVGVLGTTISPYEFFWQSNEEVEELVQEHAIKHAGQRPTESNLHLRFVLWDTTFGMFVSNLVMFFIILVTALTLHVHGINTIDTAAQAAKILEPLAGNATFVLFALGIISAGLISIPVLAGSSGYALADALHWRASLSESPTKDPGFYGIIVATSVAGLLVNLLPIPPFRLLFYAAVLSGVIAPCMIFIVIHIARNPKIMGRHTNSRLSNVLGWILFALITASLITWIVLTLR